MNNDAREKLVLLGATAADLVWFDAFGWRDDKVPPAAPDTLSDYRRREALLNASIAELTFAERSASQAGHLAAALGARVADIEDEKDDDDEA